MAVVYSNFFGGAFFDGGFFGPGIAKGTAAWLSPAFHARRPTADDVSKDRERFGILSKAQAVIEEVAARQAKSLEQDARKRFEELSRELALKKIEWDARYLEALNNQRERLIDAEIAKRLQFLLTERNKMILLIAAAA